jgi:hypothetical protein
MFKSNVGSIDRVVRIILGVALIGLFFAYPDASWRYFALIGIIPLLTAFMGTCPLYSIFGLSTCPVSKKS